MPITLSAGLGWYGLHRAHPDLASTTCPCDRADVAAYDRVAVDAAWSYGEPSAHAALGLSLAVSAGAAFAGAALDGSIDGEALATDLLISTEAMALAGLLTQISKTTVSRPYPYLLRSGADPAREADGVNYAAFWSGHTAAPMAAAVSSAWLFQRRHPRSPWRWAFWIAGPTLAVASGALQVSAGNHYPSDVAVGALVGAGVGLLTTQFH